MMNIADEDIDLGLALGSSRSAINQCSSGAGVNAQSRVDIAYAASDPLSELVWSPHNGLSLKCADSSLAENKPFLLGNVDPTIKDPSTSQSIPHIGDDKMIDASSSSGNDGKMEEETGNSDDIQKEENRKADFGSSKNVEIADVAESSRKNSARDILTNESKLDMTMNWQISSKLIRRTQTNQNKAFKINANRSNIMGLALPIRSEPHAAKLSEALICSLPNLQFQQEPDDEVTSASHDNKNNIPISTPGPPLVKLESCAENDLARLHGEKGKSSNDVDDSHESVESCNSASFFSKGVKKRSYDQERIFGSKRAKREIQENDSSFMNWMSNMVKGVSDSNKEESKSTSLTLALARPIDLCVNNHQKSQNTGFQTVFQSLYCRNKKMTDTRVDKDNVTEKLMLSEKTPLKSIAESCGKNKDNSGKQIILPDDEEVSPSDSLCKNVMPEKCNSRSSLWITRFYTKTEQVHESSSESPKGNLGNRETGFSSIDQKTSERDSAEDEVHATESTHKLSPVQLGQESRRSEAMTSVFAKRLDALRHIMHPSEKRPSSSTCTVICFFCGRSGHDLRKCPQLTETELEDLIVKISSFERLEESPRLCIRCFQFDHWAVSCPLKDSSRKQFSTSNEFQMRIVSNSDNDLKNRQIFPLCNFVTVAKEETFDAVRRLRLSRSDILRWMNSNVSLSHLNGFFVRLRLGKMETGLGWTGYHVACITGDTIGNVGCNSKKSILVDVGGIKSSVGSQYVSNNDFLEDEIKAWWNRIVKAGGKVPSLEELNSKLEDKKCVGL